MNGKYLNYQKVGNVVRMHVQFVPGSSFLCCPCKEPGDKANVAYDSSKSTLSIKECGRNFTQEIPCFCGQLRVNEWYKIQTILASYCPGRLPRCSTINLHIACITGY